MPEYSVYLHESLDENHSSFGSGPTFILETDDIGVAMQTVRQYRQQYPNGACWIEDSHRTIIKVV